MRLRRGADLESRVVWLLGGPRTGSSWLLELLVHPLMPDPAARCGARRPPGDSAVPVRAIPVNEPYFGVHLAPVMTIHPVGVFTASDSRDGDSSYVFDPRYAAVWQPAVR